MVFAEVGSRFFLFAPAGVPLGFGGSRCSGRARAAAATAAPTSRVLGAPDSPALGDIGATCPPKRAAKVGVGESLRRGWCIFLASSHAEEHRVRAILCQGKTYRGLRVCL